MGLKYTNIKNQPLVMFITSFVLFLLFMTVCRFFADGVLDFSRDWGYAVNFSLLFALLTAMWGNSAKYLKLCAVFVVTYLLSSLLKHQSDMLLSGREIVQTIGVSLIMFAVFSIIFYITQLIENNVFRHFLKILALVVGAFFLLPALVFIGYFAVGEGVFSADVVLAILQTNSNEALSYLKDKNLWLWSGGVIVIVAILISFSLYAASIKIYTFHSKPFILAVLWLTYTAVMVLPKLNLCPLVNIILTTRATLAEFDNFRKSQIERESKLNHLREMALSSNDKGVYVLVIGESQSSDHMQVYGYNQPTTPWMSSQLNSHNTIIYKHAYANHTHTVPALTYALSEKNQYNKMEITEAFTLIEVANAAGYKTYWLSNQSRYGVYDTPISVIAGAADYQRWLNNSTGDKIFTTYLDEKLVETLPPDNDSDKMLIVIHLMGLHSSYQDRYPDEFAAFDTNRGHVDEYDNSTLYNDYVLSKIYNKVRQYPNFMAMVYVSDHGDDADKALGHTSTKFTFPMARIPLMVNVSDSYIQNHYGQYKNLRYNQDAYWTNDLLYDLMVRLLGINGLPNLPERFNLLSDKYNMPWQEVLVLHGKKTLEEEIRGE